MWKATFSADGFSRGERLQLVEVTVVQRRDDHVDQPFQFVEVHHHADRIESAAQTVTCTRQLWPCRGSREPS